MATMKIEMSCEEFVPLVEMELGITQEKKFFEGAIKMLKAITLTNPRMAVHCTAALLLKEGTKHYPLDDKQQVIVPVMTIGARAIEKVNILHSARMTLQVAQQFVSAQAQAGASAAGIGLIRRGFLRVVTDSLCGASCWLSRWPR